MASDATAQTAPAEPAGRRSSGRTLRWLGLLLGLMLWVPRQAAARCLIEVQKAKRLLTLRRGHAVHQFPIRLGRHPVGQKWQQGDFRTPEGRYRIVAKRPNSRYTQGLLINYPNRADRARVAPTGKDPGGAIFIHGQKRGVVEPYQSDWTRGCIALSNPDMRLLYDRVSMGCSVVIAP